MGKDFPTLVQNQLRSLAETSLLSPLGQTVLVKRRVLTLQQIGGEARRMVSNPALGFVFVHLATPHGPHPYDRFKKTLTKSNALLSRYLDSLALADPLLWAT